MGRTRVAGLRANCWGYNGRVNSTVIEAVEGERIRICVTNRLPVATSIHWHGIYLPNGMDGVAGLTQPYIKAGETGKYEWTLRQYGSFMFHSHHDEMTQMGMGADRHVHRPPKKSITRLPRGPGLLAHDQ
jgi:manganese oxidase